MTVGGDRAAFRAVVRGRVQGVGFREFVRRRARSLGLAGWVRNGDDGVSVEVHAEGPPEALEALRRELARGLAIARVDAVDVEPAEPRGLAEFAVRF